MITLGIAAGGPPFWSMIESCWQLESPEPLRFLRQGPLAVDVARNEVVRAFLQTDSRWLLMVDTDAVLHPKTLVRLLSWNQPVVSALSFQRYGPCVPTVMRGQTNDTGDPFQALYATQVGEIRQWLLAHPTLLTSGPALLDPRPDDALSPTDRTGAHCILLRRDVLEAIDDPWFVGNPRRRYSQEDMIFCDQVRSAGFEIWTDRSVTTGHLYGERSLAGLDFIVWDSVSEYDG